MKAVIIGSGSLATQLSLALRDAGVTIVQVFSRTPGNAEILGTKLGTKFTSSISDIDSSADIYFYALKDSAFKSFIRAFDMPNAIHVHTAGSLSLSEFDGFATRYGVFYPVQTFSKNKEVDFSQIPICIEASNSEVEQQLTSLAKSISKKIYNITSEQRRQLHLAAVFACNFSNYMYDIASCIMEDSGLSFEIIKPLIVETAEKVETLTPYNAQSGPAVRYDERTIKKHLSMLNYNSDFKKIYKLMSKNIYNRHKKKKH